MIFRFRHNINTPITDNFEVIGVGVDYINFPNSNRTNQDIINLNIGELPIWKNIPLFALKRTTYFYPFGYKFAHPFYLPKNKLLRWYVTRPGVGDDDVHLLFYGSYVSDDYVKRNPHKNIYLQGFDIPQDKEVETMSIEHSFDLLSIGLLLGTTEYTTIQDDLLGFIDAIGIRWFLDENKNRSLNKISDLFLGYRYIFRDVNIPKIRFHSNQVLRLNLAKPLNTNRLRVIFEYERA